MREEDRLSAAIREQREIIAAAQHKLAILEQASALIGGSSFNPLSGDKPAVDPTRRRPGRTSSSTSGPGLAADAIRRSGGALHIDEILSEVSKRGGTTNKAGLLSTIHKMAKKGKTFVAIKGMPATFGLLEMREKDERKRT